MGDPRPRQAVRREYDPLYGDATGVWTTDMFVEAAYRSLGNYIVD